MKKVLLGALLALTTTAISAKETKFLPIVTDDNYCLSPAVAVLGGYGKYNGVDGTAMYGIELSIACPALQLSSLDIKQQISLTHQKKDDFSATNLEFNPHVMFELGKKLQLGVGPGFGVVFAKDDESDTVFSIGAGASLNYDISNSMFIGLESRYMWTTEAELSTGNKENLDNQRTLLKVGMHF